jgi:hypothetical protein
LFSTPHPEEYMAFELEALRGGNNSGVNPPNWLVLINHRLNCLGLNPSDPSPMSNKPGMHKFGKISPALPIKWVRVQGQINK